MRVELRFVHGVRAGQVIPLEDNQTLILGRGTDTNCRIQDPSISRRHCQVTNCARGVLIADIGSSNGTYVNGQRIASWVALNPGDQVVLGQNQFDILGPGQAPMPMGTGVGMNLGQTAPGALGNMSRAGMGIGGTGVAMQVPQAGAAMPMSTGVGMNVGQMAAGGMGGGFAQRQQCGGCGREISPAEMSQGRVRQDQQGRLICADCVSKYDFDPNMVEGYRIEYKLGQGAFGCVYRAQQGATGRIVALKTVRPQLVQNEKDIARFFREAKSGAALVHPNVIRVYDAGESRGTYFIAMEYVEGREVAKLIEQYGRLDVGYSLRVGIQIANALQHAYERTIVHRDIKPENILVTAQGQAKLVDFGLAKNFQQAGNSGLTAPGEGMGTLAYMPPEQLDNALMADQRSDIYSLGATIYHMVTGKRPFNEKTTRQFIMKILNKMPTAVTEIVPGAPAELGEILERAMAKEPEDRYEIPSEFEADLKGLFEKLARQHGAR